MNEIEKKEGQCPPQFAAPILQENQAPTAPAPTGTNAPAAAPAAAGSGSVGQGSAPPVPPVPPAQSSYSNLYSPPPASPSPPLPLGRLWVIAALLSWVFGICYVRFGLTDQPFLRQYGELVFSLAAVLAMELFCRFAGRTGARESWFWALCLVLLAGSLSLMPENDPREPYASLIWHGTAVWYLLSRTGMLSEGKTGSLFPADLLSGFITLPFGNFFLRERILCASFFRALKRRGSGSVKKFFITIFSCLAALLLGLMAWSLLAAADVTFASWGEGVSGWLRGLWQGKIDWLSVYSWIITVILGIPVGQWLFGLAGGGLRRTEPRYRPERLRAALARCRVLPRASGWIVMSCLTGVYALFFTAQAITCYRTLQDPAFDVFSACQMAVQGFWELCGVMLLSLTVLLVWSVFGRRPLREDRALRVLAAVFTGFTIAIALLAAVKLGVYVGGYGMTARRVIAAWWISVLALTASFSAVGLWRSFPGTRWAVWYAAASFTAVCLLPLPIYS